MEQKNNSTTLFIDKDSWVQRLHPFTKLSYVLLTGVVVYSGLFNWKQTVLVLLFNTVVVIGCKILKETCQALWKVMLPLSLFMIPIHSILYPDNETALFTVSGIIVYQEGLFFALITLLKLTVVLMTSLLFVFSTHPADLTRISHQAAN